VATSISADHLSAHIETLLKQREQHIQAIGQIDKTLASVAAVLGGSPAVPAAIAKPAAAPVTAKAPAAKGKKLTQFAESASSLVLAFVKANKNPTTLEIMKHLASKGRTATSGSNALSTLAKANKLKRTPLGKGILGSRYSLP
jgi:hypothetical protein